MRMSSDTCMESEQLILLVEIYRGINDDPMDVVLASFPI